MKTKTAEKGWLQVRVDPVERNRADRIIKCVRERLPIATRAGVVRAALRIGLDALEKDPGLAVSRGTSPHVS